MSGTSGTSGTVVFPVALLSGGDLNGRCERRYFGTES